MGERTSDTTEDSSFQARKPEEVARDLGNPEARPDTRALLLRPATKAIDKMVGDTESAVKYVLDRPQRKQNKQLGTGAASIESAQEQAIYEDSRRIDKGEVEGTKVRDQLGAERTDEVQLAQLGARLADEGRLREVSPELVGQLEHLRSEPEGVVLVRGTEGSSKTDSLEQVAALGEAVGRRGAPLSYERVSVDNPAESKSGGRRAWQRVKDIFARSSTEIRNKQVTNLYYETDDPEMVMVERWSSQTGDLVDAACVKSKDIYNDEHQILKRPSKRLGDMLGYEVPPGELFARVAKVDGNDGHRLRYDVAADNFANNLIATGTSKLVALDSYDLLRSLRLADGPVLDYYKETVLKGKYQAAEAEHVANLDPTSRRVADFMDNEVWPMTRKLSDAYSSAGQYSPNSNWGRQLKKYSYFVPDLAEGVDARLQGQEATSYPTAADVKSVKPGLREIAKLTGGRVAKKLDRKIETTAKDSFDQAAETIANSVDFLESIVNPRQQFINETARLHQDMVESGLQPADALLRLTQQLEDPASIDSYTKRYGGRKVSADDYPLLSGIHHYLGVSLNDAVSRKHDTIELAGPELARGLESFLRQQGVGNVQTMDVAQPDSLKRELAETFAAGRLHEAAVRIPDTLKAVYDLLPQDGPALASKIRQLFSDITDLKRQGKTAAEIGELIIR